MQPGGEEEERGRWKDMVHYQRGGGKATGKPVTPTKLLHFPLQDEHCHSSASLLGKENTRTWRATPTGGGARGQLCLPLPLLTLLGAVEGLSWPRGMPIAPKSLKLLTGESWTPEERNLLHRLLLLLCQHCWRWSTAAAPSAFSYSLSPPKHTGRVQEHWMPRGGHGEPGGS